MRALLLEGDPDEVTKALQNLGVSSATSSAALSLSSTDSEKPEERSESTEEDSDPGLITTPLARKVITRIPLKPMPKQMLTIIYEAGEKGILGTNLAKKLGYSSAQFRGMMGAFGRRIANTPGYSKGYFFSYEWDYDKGTYRYWLSGPVREAVRIEVIQKN